MKVARLEFNVFGVNTYVVWDPATMEAAVIDPGMADPDECERFKQFIERENLQVVKLINTHLHVDHVLGDEYVMSAYDVGLTACAADAFLGDNVGSQAAMFHLRGVSTEGVTIAVEVKDGDIIEVGSGVLKVLEVPGHTPGSIALYDAADGFVITGDALFAGSVGRTDLPGGDHATLISAIKSKLLSLPDSTVVYPGHGPSTTIGAEKRDNPFL